MNLSKNVLMLIWLLFKISGSGGIRLNVNRDFETWEDVVFKHLVENPIIECQIVLIGERGNSALERKIRHMSERFIPFWLVNPEQNEMIPKGPHLTYFKTVAYAFPSPSCITVVSDVTRYSLLESTLSFLEEHQFQEWPFIKIVFFGTKEGMNEILDHYLLRNTISMIYILPEEDNHLREEDKRFPSTVNVFSRCFFCDGGNPQKVLVKQLKRTNQYQSFTNLFPEMPNNFEGHQFNIVALSWYPITALEPLTSKPCTETIPKDSVDVRMVTEVSKLLNFRYIVRFPCDNQWGTDDGKGNWSGTVGTLQHNQGDFSFLLSLYHSRLRFIDYSRPYILEPVTFVAQKPQALPRSMALLRPFEVKIWATLIASLLVAPMVLWIFYNLSFGLEVNQQEPKKSLLDSFFLTFGLLLQEPTFKGPAFHGIRIFIGFWCLYCMIITFSYSSSLMAHLTIPGQTKIVNYASELVESGTWTWGYEPMYDSGWTWFKDSENYYYQAIFKKFELLWKEDQMKKVLAGNHAYFTYYYYIKSIIESEYTDSRGYTPIYIAKEKYLNYGGYGWAFRKGAPFRLKIDKIMHRIIQAGLIDYWMGELISVKARQSRKERRAKNPDQKQDNRFETESNLIVLTLDHMQGSFYLFMVGCGLAFCQFVVEVIFSKFCDRSNKMSSSIKFKNSCQLTKEPRGTIQ